jgi:hypothetical protein
MHQAVIFDKYKRLNVCLTLSLAVEALSLVLLITFRTQNLSFSGDYQRVRKKMLAMLVSAIADNPFVS